MRNYKLISICSLIQSSIPFSRLGVYSSALRRSPEAKLEVKSSFFQGDGESPYHLSNLLMGHCVFLYSSLPACLSFEDILLYVVPWSASSLTIMTWVPPDFPFSEIICNHMVRINFLKNLPNFLTVFLSCLLRYLPFFLKFLKPAYTWSLGNISFSDPSHSKITWPLFSKVFCVLKRKIQIRFYGIFVFTKKRFKVGLCSFLIHECWYEKTRVEMENCI